MGHVTLILAQLDPADRQALLSALCPVCREHAMPTVRPAEPPQKPDLTYNPARGALEAAALAGGITPTGLDVLWRVPPDLRAHCARLLLSVPEPPAEEAALRAHEQARVGTAVAIAGRPDGLDELWALPPEHRRRLAGLLASDNPPRHGPPPDGGWPQLT